MISSMVVLFTIRLRGSNKRNPMNVRFDDLVSLDKEKSKFREISNILKEGVEYKITGLEFLNGIMLYGRPKTGKTTLVHALAQETGVSFFYVSAHEISAVEADAGVSKIKSLFIEAKAGAPSIIYICNIHCIAQIEKAHPALFELLTQMKMCQNEKKIVLVIVSTNSQKPLDPALKSCGNFSVEVHTSKPDEDGRRKLMDLYLRKYTREEDREAFCNLVASRTQGLVAPQLASIAAISIQHALITRGDDHVILDDVLEALD